MAREAFGEEVVEHYVNNARVELAAFESVVTDWDKKAMKAGQHLFPGAVIVRHHYKSWEVMESSGARCLCRTCRKIV